MPVTGLSSIRTERQQPSSDAMQIPSQHFPSPGDASAAMTPMIDVVFLLLIFFVCAAAGTVQEKVLATDLASSGGIDAHVPPPEREPWIVEMWLRLGRDAAGRLGVDVNGTAYSDLDRLEQQLTALAAVEASNPVILDVGPGVPWGDVIDVYDRCRRAGLASVNFATDVTTLAPPR